MPAPGKGKKKKTKKQIEAAQNQQRLIQKLLKESKKK
jgi:hypothetical protein